ncbi:MAG: type II toxin-antitoxin system PemK/MazF family toxin [Armatimonadetes bacterium]|nr:type II toxin-antitoxin system PemK/MazF family toxin [Armatimonadota bacterium]
MVKPGDIVVADFAGATGVKRRPAVVVTTDLYHSHHPDVMLGVLTSQAATATTPTDYVLQDWAAAGLHAPSAFRAYVGTYVASALKIIGHLSDRDWQEVQTRLALALAVN